MTGHGMRAMAPTWMAAAAAVSLSVYNGHEGSQVAVGAPPFPAVARQVRDTTLISATAPVHPRGGRLIEDLSIGALDGPELYTFGSVAAVAVGPDMSMVVADEALPAI